GNPELDVALAPAHANFQRLLADRLVREHPDPELAAALHVAADGTARRLDLAGGQAAGAGRLQAVLAEAHAGAAGGNTAVAALALLAELGSLGLQHVADLPLRRSRLGATGLVLDLLVAEDLALENPDLDADDAVGRLGFREAVVDVGAQRVQRHAALAVPLGARDLGAVQ